MTEYDYSPEAYQHYLDKMHSISKWAEDTEHYRPEYKNAAALIEGEQNRGRSSPPSRERSRRRAPPPPPLPLPPIGHDYGMHPAYPSPAASFDPDFAYAHGLGSPGPMPPYYPGATQISLISPPISPMGPMPSYRPSHHEHRHHHSSSRHSSRRGRSRSRGPSRSSSISYGPGSSVMYAPPVSAPPYGSGYYVAAPPTRHSHHSHYQGPVIYV